MIDFLLLKYLYLTSSCISVCRHRMLTKKPTDMAEYGSETLLVITSKEFVYLKMLIIINRYPVFNRFQKPNGSIRK